MGIQIQKGDTLWGIAKQSVHAQNGDGQKVTNQQIVDEMNRIAHDSGYESVDECVKDNFYAKNGEFGSLNVKGLEIEHSEESAAEETEETSVGEPLVEEADEEASAEELAAEDDTIDGEQALKYTTFGAGGTFAAKTVLKVGNDIAKDPNVKNATKKAADVTRKTATKLKGKVDAAKVKRARNSQAAKIREARKAADASKAAKTKLKAEQAKLRSLKANKASQEAIKAQEKVVANAKASSVKANNTMKVKRKAAGLNKTTGQPLKNKKIVKTPGGKVAKASTKKVTKTASKKVAKTAAKKVAKTASKKVAKTAAKKVVVKAAAKAGGKTLLKKIPGVGLLAGVVFAVDRATHGDWVGAAGEVASGAVSCIPGVGTGASVVIDAALMARDLKNS